MHEVNETVLTDSDLERPYTPVSALALYITKNSYYKRQSESAQGSKAETTPHTEDAIQ